MNVLGKSSVWVHSRLGALHVGASVFLLMAAAILVKTGRDALYFQKDGILDLPKAYLGIAILSLPMALATLGLNRLGGAAPSCRRKNWVAQLAAPMVFDSSKASRTWSRVYSALFLVMFTRPDI